ncbi:DUF5753 domain-containing protein [Streptomyces reniochalinae]|uniref:DUF5753 domain-containing protein n=1 Tax=Streptomyces reniochalinae TaxID=2250578 RepID=UPI00319E3106
MSQVEAGKILPSMRFAEACDHVFGTGDLFVRQLRRVVEGEYPEWFAPYIDAERRATDIRDFSTVLVMGLLQTERYARAVLGGGRLATSGLDLDAAVMSRLRRREVLEQADPPHVWVVLHEACLWAEVGSAHIMVEQLGFLLHAMKHYPMLTLQVRPLGAEGVSVTAPFTLLNFSGGKTAVYVEGPQGGQPYETPETVTKVAGLYDQLRACSLGPQASEALISDVRSAHERNVDQVHLQRQPRGPVRRVGPGSHVRRGRRPRA